MLRSCEKSISRKKPVLYIEKFPSPVLPGNRLKTKENVKLLALKVVAVAYERWSLTKVSWQCNDSAEKLLVFWKTGRRGEMVATPYIGYIGMCGPKGYGFSAVLVINRVSILADFGHFGHK